MVARGFSQGEDPYQTLGVEAGASRDDIVRAYHRAALGSHPDARPADPLAAARFQAITEAYDLLSDARRRAEYDRSPSGRHDVADSAPPWPAGTHQAGRSPGPPLWAGPVHVEPATAQPAGQDAQGIVHPADAYDLLTWWLRNIWRRPR
jgi:curved DNA-binding protein CbpA